MPMIAASIAFTIANGTSLGPSISLGAGLPVTILMPAAWTTANLTFQISYDGTNFYNLYDDAGNEVTVTAAASEALAIDPSYFQGALYLKVRSGTNGTPANQGADRILSVVTRRDLSGII